MDRIVSSIAKLSASIDNFEFGVVVLERWTELGPLKQMEDSFKFRRSQALIESAYMECPGIMGNLEDYSSLLSVEKPRLMKREKIRHECQQSAMQGMAGFPVLHNMILSWKTVNNAPESVVDNNGLIRSKLYELISECTRRTSYLDEHDDIISREKSLFEKIAQFQYTLMEIKKEKDCLSQSIQSDTKAKLTAARNGLDQMNFMRRLIVALVGAKRVNLSLDKDIAEIVLNRCMELKLLNLY